MWTSHTASLASAGGHLELLKWMRSRPYGQSCPWGADSCAAAATYGQLEVLKWLRLPDKPEGQCQWDAETSFGAAAAGHVHVLEWQRSDMAGTNAKDSFLPLATIGAVAAVAAEKGQLGVMKVRKKCYTMLVTSALALTHSLVSQTPLMHARCPLARPVAVGATASPHLGPCHDDHVRHCSGQRSSCGAPVATQSS